MDGPRATTRNGDFVNGKERRRWLWRAAQAVALLATLVMIAGLFLRPDTTLLVLWSVIIPIVPASLLVTPKAWRNVCPLATLNMLSSGRLRRGSQSPRFAAGANTLGILLLVALVPARHIIFNTHGTALAFTIIAVALAALVLGSLFDAKAGFCNAICPILPVERLYGQSPLIEIDNPRCTPCSACARACVDLIPRRNIANLLGRTNGDHNWLVTPFGAFAAAFPGFVFGYFTVADGPLEMAGAVYINVVLWAAASYALIAIITVLTGSRAEVSFRWIAALAAGIYYWFAAPAIISALGGPRVAADGGAPAVVVLRVLALGLVMAWLWRASVPRKSRVTAAAT